MLSNLSILLIEDNPTDALLIRKALRLAATVGRHPVRSGEVSVNEANFHVQHVERLRDGLALASEQRFDVVLLDLGLPDSDGLNTFRRFRQSAPFVPVILLTGADEALGPEALREGAQDFLAKDEISGRWLARAIRYAVERHRAEEELRRSEQRYRLIGESLPYGVWVCGPDGGCEFLSDSFLELIGMGLDEARQFGWMQSLPTEDAPSIREQWLRCVRDGEDWDCEYRIRDVNGKQHGILSRGRPVRNAVGEIISWVGIHLDITDRQRAEHTSRFLGEASATLAELVDYESTLQKVARLAVPHFADWCAVHLVGDDGTLRPLAVAHADPQKVHRVEELVRRYPPDRNAPAGAARVLRTGQSELAVEISDALLKAAAQDEEHLRILRELGLKSYMSVPLSLRGKALGVITFLLAESGRHYRPGDLAVAEDLAHRASIAIENSRLYEELREADRRKDEFLAMLAHELRNPLAPIRSGLDLLSLSGIRHESIELMQQQVEHLVRLVDDLLDVSRIMQGKIELRREPVTLNELVDRAAETVRPLMDAHRHQFTVERPEGPVWLDADPVRMVQVLTNLLTNAAKYTETGGQVRLAVREEGEWAVIAVRDTGIGIDERLLPHIFDLFVQADRSLERSQGGLGIGLTLVRSLVKMHGGTVTAYSAGAKSGTEFTVRLPVRKPVTRPDGDGQPPLPTGSYQVLVVDDNVVAARMLTLLVSKMGRHRVRVAHDGHSALQAAESWRPDLILLDIGLPGLNGYEVAKRLRSRPELDGVLLVALTGYGTEDDRRRSLEAGFDQHLVKPPSLEALRQLFVHPKLSQR